MEKRIFAAIVISIALLWIWAALAPRFFPELAKPKPVPVKTAPKTSTTGTTATTATTGTTGTNGTNVRVAPTPAPVITPIAASSMATVEVRELPLFDAKFSNRGAELVSFRLLQYKEKAGQPVELVKARPSIRTDFPFAIESQNGALANRLNSALWAVTDRVERGVHVIELKYAEEGFAATKTFRIGPEYQFDFNVTITPPVPFRVIIGPGIRTLAPEEQDSRIIMTGNGVTQRDGSFDVINREKGDRLRIFDHVDFIGVEDNYFLTVLRPQRTTGAVLRRVEFGGGKEARKDLYAGINAGSDGVAGGSAFFGPKETKLLDRYGLAAALQFGYFGIIARFLLEVLVWINSATHNYGFAIIVLTILIKIVLYPLQHKSIVSMKKMQKVQPKVEAIRSRYRKSKSDPEQRQKMNTEMMKLYQTEGINPMSGCLPMILQLPILWAFYNLLSRAIELRGAPFIWWIKDLSDKDPYYVTPILMTAAMFVQTWVTPQAGDPAQRRMFLIMPLVFGWIFKEMPSGLVIYWLVQNILTIIQQMIMNKWWKEHPAELQKP